MNNAVLVVRETAQRGGIQKHCDNCGGNYPSVFRIDLRGLNVKPKLCFDCMLDLTHFCGNNYNNNLKREMS